MGDREKARTELLSVLSLQSRIPTPEEVEQLAGEIKRNAYGRTGNTDEERPRCM